MKFQSIAVLLALCGASGVQAQDDLGERLAACAACHGEHGEGKAASQYIPHLAGKPAGYLLDQLQAFRDGRRVYPQMGWLMRNLGDDYLARIARHYAAMPARSQATFPAVDAATTARALALVQHGDPARDVPACSACHGENLAGLEPGIPALIGLPADSGIAQLGAWRTGGRAARSPDCMARVAHALDAADMRVLGTWLASQGHDAPLPPAPAGSFTPPVACGSLPAAAPAP
jgi:cytochrome c553